MLIFVPEPLQDIRAPSEASSHINDAKTVCDILELRVNPFDDRFGDMIVRARKVFPVVQSAPFHLSIACCTIKSIIEQRERERDGLHSLCEIVVEGLIIVASCLRIAVNRDSVPQPIRLSGEPQFLSLNLRECLLSETVSRDAEVLTETR